MSDPEPTPGARRELRLDADLQARLLAQMLEEQAASMRRRTLLTWVLLPCALAALVLGVVLAFSDDFVVSFMANTVATGIAWVLWRLHRERIRDFVGR